MKTGAFVLAILVVSTTAVRTAWGQGLVSDAEVNERKDQQESVVIPHRDLVYDPIANAELGAESLEPVLEQDVFIDTNIQEAPQRAIDQNFDLIPFPSVVTFNTLAPDKGYTRANYQKWDVEARGDMSYGFDSNVDNTAVARDASQVFTVGGGVMARLGSIRPDANTGLYETPCSVIADYDVAYDDYLDHPDFNSLNQRFLLSGRVGRDTFVFTPYVRLADVTSLPVIDPDRLGLTRERSAVGGGEISWQFQQLSWISSFGAGALQHPDPGLMDCDVINASQEVGYTFDRVSRVCVYGQFHNEYPTEGSYAQEFEEGVGYDYVDNEQILGRFRWKTRIGVAQPEYHDNPFQVRNNAGLRLNTEVGKFFTPAWEWIFRAGRTHTFDQTLPNDGFLDDYVNLTCRWRPTTPFAIGASYGLVRTLFDSSNNSQFLQQVSLEANYALSYHAILFARGSWSHSSTNEVIDPDIVGFRESIGIEVRF